MTSLHQRDPQGAALNRSGQFPHYTVYVTGIDTSRVGDPHSDPRGIALTVDTFGKLRQIGVSTIVGSGVYPQVGETWIVDQSLGTWTFLARQVSVTPEVTGLYQIGGALDQLGLINYTGPNQQLVMIRQITSPISLVYPGPSSSAPVALPVGNFVATGNLLFTNASKSHQHTIEIWFGVDNPAHATVAGSYTSAIELLVSTDEDSLTIGPALIAVTQPVNLFLFAQRDSGFTADPLTIAAVTTAGRAGCSSVVISQTFQNIQLV